MNTNVLKYVTPLEQHGILKIIINPKTNAPKAKNDKMRLRNWVEVYCVIMDPWKISFCVLLPNKNS